MPIVQQFLTLANDIYKNKMLIKDILNTILLVKLSANILHAKGLRKNFLKIKNFANIREILL